MLRRRPIHARAVLGFHLGLALCVIGSSSTARSAAVELAPREVRETPGGGAQARYSDRTLVVAIEVDRDRASVTSYTVKPRPYTRPLEVPEVRVYERHRPVQLEVILFGAGGVRHTRHVDVPLLCFDHGADAQPHIEGDTVRRHHTGVLVELPEIADLDRVEVAFHQLDGRTRERRVLGTDTLDARRFSRAAGTIEYRSLLIADPTTADEKAAPAGSTAEWPEDHGDTEIYRVYGDEAETDRRINIVIVPDGYTYADKALMESQADALVAAFRAKQPHTEYDAFFNYVLVYAYSLEDGTDQCDCGIVTNTAMGTFFPLSNPNCGHGDNRCILYASAGGGSCDLGGLSNLLEAELRAPAQDVTLIMVNTTRYGGCASDRATFSGSHGLAAGVAIHELGHVGFGLADEYGGPGCGSVAREINTSADGVDGAWPEWIAEIGAPREGAQYFDQCLYRPRDVCTMNWLSDPFCEVCMQHMSLETFEHPRIKPTAPIAGSTPEQIVQVSLGGSVSFNLSTRFAVGPSVQNSITWTIEGPGFAGPTVVATGTPGHTQMFAEEGRYLLTAEAVASTNFVKPSKNGANRDTVLWQIDAVVDPPAEIEGPIAFGNKVVLLWDPVPGVGYNVYRGDVLGPRQGDYGTCWTPNLPWQSAFAFETEVPAPRTGWQYLVTGVTLAGEGTMGNDSFGTERVNATPCE